MLLSNKRILIAEDVYLLADELARVLTGAGAIVVGPFPTCADALRTIASQKIDAAVLDIGLQDALVFPCARELRRAQVPYLFVTGYSYRVVPDEFSRDPYVAKPVCGKSLVDQLCALMALQKHAPLGDFERASSDGGRVTIN